MISDNTEFSGNCNKPVSHCILWGGTWGKGGEWVHWWAVGCTGAGGTLWGGGLQGGSHILCIDLGSYKINSTGICGIFSQ